MVILSIMLFSIGWKIAAFVAASIAAIFWVILFPLCCVGLLVGEKRS